MVKEFFGKGDSAVREDKPMTERQVVIAVMKHPTEEKYLCVKNKKFGWIDFVMGGIEGDETPTEAARREIMEETGYSDFEIVGELTEVYYDNFYAAHKDVNRHITCHTVYGRLSNLEQDEREDKEQELADVLWVDATELPKRLSTEAHRYDFERVSAIMNNEL